LMDRVLSGADEYAHAYFDDTSILLILTNYWYAYGNIQTNLEMILHPSLILVLDILLQLWLYLTGGRKWSRIRGCAEPAW
jgi:hypothetical protein